MKKQFPLILLILILLGSSCKKDEEPIIKKTQGYKMLLMGNSFFNPYAKKIDALAIDAGFEHHSSTTIFRGGENGRPINFWNDSSSIEHNAIKRALDQGGVDILGMTSGHESDNPIQGHKAWIAYALQKNPDITIFIAIPTIDYPADWNQRAQENGFDSIQELYEYFVNEIVHKSIVDELRAEFPSTKIFTIPTGWAAINLAQMNIDNLLLDTIEIFGPKPISIFTDRKGHQGQIVIETGSILWFNSIYNVHLRTYSDETGFDTDLHSIAEDIMQRQDPNYTQ